MPVGPCISIAWILQNTLHAVSIRQDDLEQAAESSSCRRRRIKCDERYPRCQQCTRRGRTCNLADTRFRSYEAPSRSERVAESSPAPEDAHGVVSDDPRAPPAYSRLEGDAVTDSHSGQFDELRQGSRSPQTPRFEQALATDIRNVMPSVYTGSYQPTTPLPSLRQTSMSRLMEHGAHVHHDERTVSAEDLNTLSAPSDTQERGFSSRHGLLTSEERAFFLRQFSSTTAKWMDLYDLDCFYSREVPVLALQSPIIMFSACAFAAGQLCLTTGKSPPDFSRPSNSHRHDSFAGGRGYAWIAEEYYDAAISLLRQHTSKVAAEDRNSFIRDADDFHFSGRMLTYVSNDSERVEGPHRMRLRDQVIVSVTILSNYEFLKGAAPTWSDHLDGTRSFLRLSDEAGFLDFGPSPPIPSLPPGPSMLLRATFWNFARQDMLSALIHRRRTRLEMDDLGMWQRMGINIGSDGRLCEETASSHAAHRGSARIDMVSNTLVWLLAKLVNFIASITNHADTDTWLSLRGEFRVWFDTLPFLFHPCSRVPLTTTRASISKCRCQTRALIDHKTWHSDSMCASAMQSYHMAQIFLLLHKPPAVSVRQLPWTAATNPSSGISATQDRFPDTLFDLHRMNEMLQYHAVEICAIALSRPEEAARIHMLQPLYLAGRCLTDVADRKMVVGLIDGIEDELGWHAKYRTEALLDEWGITRSALTVDCCRRAI